MARDAIKVATAVKMRVILDVFEVALLGIFYIAVFALCLLVVLSGGTQ